MTGEVVFWARSPGSLGFPDFTGLCEDVLCLSAILWMRFNSRSLVLRRRFSTWVGMGFTRGLTGLDAD